MNPGAAITTRGRALHGKKRHYAALCVLSRALVKPRHVYWLASGAGVYAWKSGDRVCVDLRHIPASHGRRLYVEGRDTAQSIRVLVRYAGLTEEDLQAALAAEHAGWDPIRGRPGRRNRAAGRALAPFATHGAAGARRGRGGGWSAGTSGITPAKTEASVRRPEKSAR